MFSDLSNFRPLLQSIIKLDCHLIIIEITERIIHRQAGQGQQPNRDLKKSEAAFRIIQEQMFSLNCIKVSESN